MRRTAFTMLLDAHDYVWFNERDSLTRRESTKMLQSFIVLQAVDGCVEVKL